MGNEQEIVATIFRKGTMMKLQDITGKMARRKFLGFTGGGSLLALTGGCAIDASNASDADSDDVGSIRQQANTAYGVQLTYLVAFNRWPTQTEISYWVGTGYSQEKILSFHRTWMRTSAGAGDRYAVIRDSYAIVYKRPAGTNEWNYWNSYLGSNDALFSDVCKWHEASARSGGFARTGSYTIKHWHDDISLPGIEDYTGSTYSVPAS